MKEGWNGGGVYILPCENERRAPSLWFLDYHLRTDLLVQYGSVDQYTDHLHPAPVLFISKDFN